MKLQEAVIEIRDDSKTESSVIFNNGKGERIWEMRSNGDIYWRGRKIGTDEEAMLAFKDAILATTESFQGTYSNGINRAIVEAGRKKYNR